MCCRYMMFQTFGLKWNPQGQMALCIMSEETNQHFYYSNQIQQLLYLLSRRAEDEHVTSFPFLLDTALPV